MSDPILNESTVRLGVFLVVLSAIATWEWIAPRRHQRIPRTRRWPANLGIVVLDGLVLRLLFSLAATGVAALARAHHWGLLNTIPLPGWLSLLIAVVLLDLAIYFQHVLFQAVPVFWRLHRMHHADLEFDVTTGLRFHPGEIILSLLIKFGVIAALGPTPLAVLVFEVLLNATSMFEHGNVRLPERLDRILRWLMVTPDMHRVHHSWHPEETNSNFGFNLSWWDRLFGTYLAQPRDGQNGMTIGINQFRDPRELGLARMLRQPFKGPVHSYPINRHDSDQG